MGFIRLQRTSDGQPILENPQEDCRPEDIHPKLEGPFCRLRLPELPKSAGVYVVVTNGTPAYVGSTENLHKRWHSGYKKISKSNCKRNGQPTNCRVNHLILKARDQGQLVELLFCEYQTLEQRVIGELHPPWNVQ